MKRGKKGGFVIAKGKIVAAFVLIFAHRETVLGARTCVLHAMHVVSVSVSRRDLNFPTPTAAPSGPPRFARRRESASRGRGRTPTSTSQLAPSGT